MDNSGNQSARSTLAGRLARRAATGRRFCRSSPRHLSVLVSSALSLVGAVAGAQQQQQQQQTEESRAQRVTLAYFGERAVQPGVRAGYEATTWSRRPSELLLAGNIAGFAVPSGYGLMALIEVGYRATARFGGFIDLRPGLGYTAAWVGNGGPPTVSNYITLSALGGIGYDFYRLLKVPLSFMARSGVLWRYALPHGPTRGPLEGASFALDVGLAYQFGTGKARGIVLPVEMPPPAEAPANLDDPGTAVPTTAMTPAPDPATNPPTTSLPPPPTAPAPNPVQ